MRYQGRHHGVAPAPSWLTPVGFTQRAAPPSATPASGAPPSTAASADTANWVGGNGGNGDWNNAANWMPNGVPDPSASATFATGDSGYTVTGNATIGDILVDGDALTFDGTLTQSTDGQGQFLTALDDGQVTLDANSFVTGGGLSFESGTLLDVQGTLIDAGGSADVVIVEGLNGLMIDSGALVVDQLYVQNGASFTGAVTLTDGGSVTLDTSSSFDGGFMSLEKNGSIYAAAAPGQTSGSLGLGGSILTQAGGVLELAADPGVTLLVGGAITGGGTLLVSGGTVELSGDNSYTGFTTVLNGTLQLDTPGALPSGIVFVENGAFVDAAADGAIYADTVIASGASDTVNALAGGLLVFAGPAGALDFVGGSAASTVLGGSGVLNATGGAAGDLIYGGTSGQDTISTGAGNATIVGGAGAHLVGNGAGDAALIASGAGVFFDFSHDTGSVTLFGAAGDGASVLGGAGAVSAILNNSDATVYGGAGLTTVFSGGTAGTATLALDYVRGLAGGTSAVIGFDASRDVINLFSYASGEAQSALANETVSGGNTVLQLSDNTRIELFGVTNLTMSNFTTH